MAKENPTELAMSDRGLDGDDALAVMVLIQGGEIPHVIFTGKSK